METWLLYALGGAIFGAMVTILAKIGLKEVDSNLATAVRTVVVLFFAWGIVFAIGAQGEVFYIDARTWTFLMLSGLATGGSWLCFFRALQLAEVNQVTPLKKSSTILTIILAVIFLGEPMGIFTILGLVLIAAGTWFMIKPNKKPAENQSKGFVWFLFALAAAIFASLTAIFARIGFENIDATLGTAIRTLAVLPISWLMVFLTRKKKSKPTSFRACEEINVQDCEGFLSQCEEGKPPLARGKQGFSDEAMRQKDKQDCTFISEQSLNIRAWTFLILSGFATGASWLLFFRALQLGEASRVVPIDKLSIVFTMLFARIFLAESFSRRSLIGLALLVLGTLVILL